MNANGVLHKLQIPYAKKGNGVIVGIEEPNFWMVGDSDSKQLHAAGAAETAANLAGDSSCGWHWSLLMAAVV